MAKNDEFNMLNNLFTTPIASPKASNIEENTKKSPTTQRTWKIKDELWDDFTTLVSMSGMTQAEYINKLIENDIKDNIERIVRYREFFGR